MTNEKVESGAELPERGSAGKKTEVVLRLLRGESVEEVSREIQVPAHELEEWRRVFLETGSEGLKRRGLDAEEREVRKLQAKIGEMTMRLELAEYMIEKKGYGSEYRRLKK
jgi:transposase-like protein